MSDVQSSYEVYIAPFKPFVWVMLVAAACVSCFVEAFLLRGVIGHPSSIASDMYNLLFWKLSTFFGLVPAKPA